MPRRLYRAFTTFLPVLVTAACSVNVEITGSVPRPVVEPIALKVGVYYSESLREYVHDQRFPDGGVNFQIALGAAQLQLFDQILGALFAEVVAVDNLTSVPESANLALILRPEVQGVSLRRPYDTGGEFYEVSIQCNLFFHRPTGEFLSAWAIEGYGRSPSRLLDMEASILDATQHALRDVATLTTLRLREEAERNGLPMVDWITRAPREDLES